MALSEERDSIIELNLQQEKDMEQIIAFGEAISSETRLKILKTLQVEPFVKSVPQLVKELNIPTTTLMHHLEKLQKGNLIKIRYKGSSNGTTRIVSRSFGKANIKLNYGFYQSEKERNFNEQSLGVGCYADYTGDKLLFATDTELYSNIDTPFTEKRYTAQLIYTTYRIITYYFSNSFTKSVIVKELSISLEISSESPYYDNDYLSDITFWINDKEVATYLSLGDYGDRRGVLTPSWWSSRNSQYGKMVEILVNEEGVFLNKKLVNQKINLKDLNLADGNKIKFAFGNKATDKNIGGFNVFGKNFGDFPQDIVLKIFYE